LAIPGSKNTLEAAKKGAIGGPNTIPNNKKSAKKLTQLTCNPFDKIILLLSESGYPGFKDLQDFVFVKLFFPLRIWVL
jgi:hypothetical protein